MVSDCCFSGDSIVSSLANIESPPFLSGQSPNTKFKVPTTQSIASQGQGGAPGKFCTLCWFQLLFQWQMTKIRDKSADNQWARISVAYNKNCHLPIVNNCSESSALEVYFRCCGCILHVLACSVNAAALIVSCLHEECRSFIVYFCIGITALLVCLCID